MAREKTLARRERGELGQMEPLEGFRDMERMFRNFFLPTLPLVRQPRWLRQFENEFIPEVDLRETDKDYILSATVPGMGKDDISIDVTDDTITISGERKHEEDKPGEKYHIREQSYGSFSVSYTLPSEVKADDVKAVYNNGILEVTLPKAEVKEAHKVKVEDKG